MVIKKVIAVYFSPAGSTAKVTEKIAGELAATLDVPLAIDDFTLPQSRESARSFAKEELIVFGVPTYAGRIPNKALPFVQELFRANDTPTVCVATFGNRNYDNVLAELTYELGNNGFIPFVAAAVPARHAFSDRLAGGRPDEDDFAELVDFSKSVVAKLPSKGEEARTEMRKLDLGEVGPYYVPLGMDGHKVNFLKAKPVTDMDLCDDCKICAESCPMGSIEFDDVSAVSGICIKCHACIRKCPQEAKKFDDAGLESHRRMLEINYAAERKEIATFL